MPINYNLGLFTDGFKYGLMQAKISTALRFSLGLLLLGLIGWIVYSGILAIVGVLASIKSDLAVAIIAASASITVSVLSLIISKRLESQAVIIQELRARKTPIYEEFISTLYRVVFANKIGEEPMSEEELVKFFANYTEKLTIWGSDDVIKAYRRFRMASVANELPTNSMFLYENLLFEIRRDLGHKNQGFKRGTLLGLFVNDIDQHL